MPVSQHSSKVLCWPRPYLSWSQYQTFRFKGPEEYAKVYIYGEGEENPAMQLGKRVADMAYSDEEQDDPVLEHLRTFLPQYEHKEYEIPRLRGDDKTCKCEKCLARGIEKPLVFNGVPLYGIMDRWTEEGFRAGELKTARSLANEKMWCEQLKFYTLLLHLKFGIAPEKINWTISWMPTEWEVGNVVRPTGEIENMEAKVTANDLLEIGARIPKVWEAIGRFTAKEYKSLGL